MTKRDICQDQHSAQVIRPVQMADLPDLYDLAKRAGDGLTTLPINQQRLEDRITQSQQAFAHQTLKADQEASYLLVLEDMATGKIVGTSGIFVGVGLSKAFYTYRILTLTQISQALDKRVQSEVLTLSNDYTGATEIGTLFLDPAYRCHGNGSLLSRSRYLLMAACPERFSSLVMAEMRGWLDENGHSPFWEALGRHFFQLPFSEADYISGIGNNQFIADLMPHYPIYIQLLPKAAQNVIGKTHDQTVPAIKMLEKEGFRQAKAVDIFDAGPVMDVPRQEIATVKQAKFAVVDMLRADGDDQQVLTSAKQRVLVSTTDCADFRVIWASIDVISEGRICLSRFDAESLHVEQGDRVIYVP